MTRELPEVTAAKLEAERASFAGDNAKLVTQHTKLEGDIGADSNGKVGVKMEWDY